MIRDYEAHRAHFLKVNLKDPAQVKLWLEETLHLGTTIQAMIAQRRPRAIREWRSRVGIIGKAPVVRLRSQTLPVVRETIEVPENWRSAEWLSQVVQRHSVKQLSLAIKVNRRTVYKALRRANIAPPVYKPKSNHPNCNREWVYHHYVERRLSVKACAQLAGVADDTVYNWMAKFKINPRPPNGPSKLLVNELWVRELYLALLKQPLVRSVKLGKAYMHVRYRTFAWDNFCFSPDGRSFKGGWKVDRHTDLERIVHPTFQYETELGKLPYPHLQLSRDELSACSVVERCLSLQQFIWQLHEIYRGDWVPPRYPVEVLQQDWGLLRTWKGSCRNKKGDFIVYNSNAPTGHRITEHFFDLSIMRNFVRSPRKVKRALEKMVKKRIVITTHNLLRQLRELWLPAIAEPLFYVALFQHLGVTDEILDLDPGFGSKAMACALLGLEYTTMPHTGFDQAMRAGFGEFIGLRYRPYGGQQVQLTIADREIRDIDIAAALKYLPQSKLLLVYSMETRRAELEAAYQPDAVIPLRDRKTCVFKDYFLLWQQRARVEPKIS